MVIVRFHTTTYDYPTMYMSLPLGAWKSNILILERENHIFLIFHWCSCWGGLQLAQVDGLSRGPGMRGQEGPGLSWAGELKEGYVDGTKISFNWIAREAKRRKTCTFIPSPWKVLESINYRRTKCNVGIDVESKVGNTCWLFHISN